MNVEIISTHAEFLKLKSDWDDVYLRDPDAQFFLSWKWLSNVFAQTNEDWFVIAVRSNCELNRYIAFFPLLMQTHLSRQSKTLCNQIRVAGRLTWSDYSGILVLPELEEKAIPLVAARLQKMHWRDLYLKNILISDRRLTLFLNQFDNSLFSHRYLLQTGRTDKIDRLICPFIELDETFEAYLTHKLSANSRQKLRRHLRKIDQSDDLKITHSTPDTQQKDLDILISFWKNKWRVHKGKDTERLAIKYRQILEIGLTAECLFMPVLWQGERAVAALAIFIDHQKKQLLYFVAGRDETFKNPSPGLVLHAHSIRWAIENGFKQYDFLRGNEPFKYSLGATQRKIRYLAISTQSGSNLHQSLDPEHLNQALIKTHGYLKKKQYEQAEKAIKQIIEAQAAHSKSVRQAR